MRPVSISIAVESFILLAIALPAVCLQRQRLLVTQSNGLAFHFASSNKSRRSNDAEDDNKNGQHVEGKELDDSGDAPYGIVARTAYRANQGKNSIPSGKKYTTMKDSRTAITITKQGIAGDYNHYRTNALQSTSDRAVSLWTTDVLSWLHTYSYFEDIRVGDFGENISISDVEYTFFRVGEQYRFATTKSNDGTQRDDNSGVVIEITERMEPCANLCKLPYINRPDLNSKARIERCKNLLTILDREDGLRGWYAKVIQEGTIRPGHCVMKKEPTNE